MFDELELSNAGRELVTGNYSDDLEAKAQELYDSTYKDGSGMTDETA
jgi:hypothetical protein